MAQGISEVLTYAIGVAISALAIIAVILMLFSRRAKVVFVIVGSLTIAGPVVFFRR